MNGLVKRLNIDTYILLLVTMVALASVLTAHGVGATNRGEGTDNQITVELLRSFAADARAQIKSKDGGFGHHHLQTLL